MAMDGIIIAGQAAAFPDQGSFAGWMSTSRKPPVSGKEQAADWSAVCGVIHAHGSEGITEPFLPLSRGISVEVGKRLQVCVALSLLLARGIS
jgi:hypothetical protein